MQNTVLHWFKLKNLEQLLWPCCQSTFNLCSWTFMLIATDSLEANCFIRYCGILSFTRYMKYPLSCLSIYYLLFVWFISTFLPETQGPSPLWYSCSKLSLLITSVNCVSGIYSLFTSLLLSFLSTHLLFCFF